MNGTPKAIHYQKGGGISTDSAPQWDREDNQIKYKNALKQRT